MAAREHLPHTEVDLAGELDSAGHVDHRSRFGLDGTALLNVKGEHSVSVAMGDGIAASREAALITLEANLAMVLLRWLLVLLLGPLALLLWWWLTVLSLWRLSAEHDISKLTAQ